MSEPVRKHMTADEFIAWAMERPEGEHYEFVEGEIIAVAPEWASHNRIKGWLYRRFAHAIESSSLPCEVFSDGLSVEIDGSIIYEPDLMVRCGPPLGDDTVGVRDPILVVEVLSRPTRGQDPGAKLDDYFRLPSLMHYLMVKPENRTIIYHRRESNGLIRTHIVRNDSINLDPPGLEVSRLWPTR